MERARIAVTVNPMRLPYILIAFTSVVWWWIGAASIFGICMMLNLDVFGRAANCFAGCIGVVLAVLGCWAEIYAYQRWQQIRQRKPKPSTQI
jgi:cell division protein FtsW (lipid II flippase)